MGGYQSQALNVSVQSATEMIQSAIGAHLNQSECCETTHQDSD